MDNDGYTNNYVKEVGVNFEDLWYSSNGYLIFDNAEDDGGKPFSGIAYELYDNGNLVYFRSYKEGLSHGLYRKFYRSGYLMCEAYMEDGVIAGKEVFFFEDGSKKSESNNELGIQLSYKEWDEKGNLILEKELEPDSPNYRILLKKRKAFE